MDRWKGKTAFVTGASAGIGFDISYQLCEQGMNVVGVARNIGKIEELSQKISVNKKSGKLLAIKCNVRYESEIKAAFKRAIEEFGSVEVCINNAGLGHNAPLLTGSTEEWRDMMEVNVLGVCICTREFMTHLKENGKSEGHIVLLNSIAGHGELLDEINIHFYAATKYAITAITEGIRRELREMKSEVKVTAVSPGLVRTEIVPRYFKADNIEEMMKVYGPPGQVLETEDVTSAIVYALSSPPRVQIHDIIFHPWPRKQD